MFALWIIIALLAGFAAGIITGILTAHEVVTKASAFYKELVIRGDAAMAMLKKVGDELAAIGGDGNKKRVILAGDFESMKERIGFGTNVRVEPERKS